MQKQSSTMAYLEKYRADPGATIKAEITSDPASTDRNGLFYASAFGVAKTIIRALFAEHDRVTAQLEAARLEIQTLKNELYDNPTHKTY